MLNVGWLGRDHPFPTGPIDRGAVEKLTILADSPEEIMRGLHYCEFCDEDSPIEVPAPLERGFVYLGTGEIRVKSATGTHYSAPTMVVHYIIRHRYRPPEEFLLAVKDYSGLGVEPHEG